MKHLFFVLTISLASAIANTCSVETEIIKLPQLHTTGEEIYLEPFVGYLSKPIDIFVKELVETLRINQEVQPKTEFSEHKFSWLIMIKKDDGGKSLAGILQAELHNDDVGQYFLKEYAALSFFIDPKYRGRNLAYQSSKALIKHMLAKHHTPMIYGFIFDVGNENKAAQKIMQKFVANDRFTQSLQELTVYIKQVTGEMVTGHRWYRYYRKPNGSFIVDQE